MFKLFTDSAANLVVDLNPSVIKIIAYYYLISNVLSAACIKKKQFFVKNPQYLY